MTFSENYKECKEQIKEISKETSHRFFIAAASILLAIGLMSGPITILANCFIFNDYLNFCLLGILACVYFIIFLSRVFYFKTITKKQVPNMHCFYLMDALVCAIILCVGIFVILFI